MTEPIQSNAAEQLWLAREENKRLSREVRELQTMCREFEALCLTRGGRIRELTTALGLVRDALPGWRTDIHRILEEHVPELMKDPATRGQLETWDEVLP